MGEKIRAVSNPYTALLAAASSEDLSRTVVAAEENTILCAQSELQEVRRRVMSFLRKNDFEGAKELIGGMVEFLQETCEIIGDDRLALCEEVDHFFSILFQ
jgi:hypothetical protein